MENEEFDDINDCVYNDDKDEYVKDNNDYVKQIEHNNTMMTY